MRKKKKSRQQGAPPRVAHSAASVAVDVAYAPSLPVTDKQVLEIAESLNVGKDSEHVAAVLDAIRRFRGREIAMPEASNPKRDIETLSTLAHAMDGFNTNVLARLARHGIDLSIIEPTHVAAAARESVEELKRTHPPRYRRGGARPKTSLRITVLKLAEIYKKATDRDLKISTKHDAMARCGTNQPTGKAFLFIRAAVDPVPSLRAKKDGALAQYFRRTLNKIS